MAVDIDKLQKEANAGNYKSMLDLGLCYFRGNGVQRDYNVALDLITKCVWHGYSRAACYVGDILNGHDDREAFFYYLHSAKAGSVYGQRCVALCFDRAGHCSNMSFPPKSLYGAVEWYKIAAKENDPIALRFLTIHYANGEGCAQNLYKAKENAEKGAKAGDVECMYFLGVLLDGDSYGHLFDDINQAGYWLNQAASNGNNDASDMLRRKYSYSKMWQKWTKRA